MNEDEQKIYLNYLWKPKIIHTMGKRQMDLPVTIHTLDTLESFSIKALVDSGCTGSCINSKFVRGRVATGGQKLRDCSALSFTLSKKLNH